MRRIFAWDACTTSLRRHVIANTVASFARAGRLESVDQQIETGTDLHCAHVATAADRARITALVDGKATTPVRAALGSAVGIGFVGARRPAVVGECAEPQRVGMHVD